jgi:hypothetical protein
MLILSGYVMVSSSYGFAGSEYRNSPFFQTIKSLRTGNFMYVMPVDVKNIRTIFNGSNYMAVPDFVEKCF